MRAREARRLFQKPNFTLQALARIIYLAFRIREAKADVMGEEKAGECRISSRTRHWRYHKCFIYFNDNLTAGSMLVVAPRIIEDD